MRISAYCAFLDNPDHVVYRICFVNDGSTDNTPEILELIGRQYATRVTVIHLPANRGKASAVRAGMLHFLHDGEISAIGFMDADLSTNFREYSALGSRLNGSGRHFVFGSRPIHRHNNYQRRWIRTLASILARAVIRRVVGLPVRDTQCGAKVLSREMAQRCFASPFRTKWLFDVELFLRFKYVFGREGVLSVIEEVNLLEWHDVRGSKITFMDAVEMPQQLFRIWLVYRFAPLFGRLAERYYPTLGEVRSQHEI